MIGYSKKNREIIQESAFDNKKTNPGLKFNPELANRRSNGHWTSSRRYKPYLSPQSPILPSLE